MVEPNSNTNPLENIPTAPAAGIPQDKGTADKDLAAKFQEMEKTNKELQAKLSQEAERAKQADELLNVFLTSQNQPGTPSVPANSPENPPAPPVAASKVEYAKISENPEAVLKQLKEEAKEEVKREMREEYNKSRQQEAYNRQVHDYFYAKNPDLAAHKELVGSISAKISEANRGIPVDKLLEKIASETKAKIAEIRAGGGNPPPPVVTEAGSGVMPPKTPEPAKPAVDELTAEAMARNKNRNKILT